MPWDNERINTLTILLRSIKAILLRQEKQIADWIERTERNKSGIDQQMQQDLCHVRPPKNRKRISRIS